MKKLIGFILVFCMAVGMFAGCGRQNGTESSTGSTAAGSDNTSPESSISTEASADTGGSSTEATTAVSTGDSGGTGDAGGTGGTGGTGDSGSAAEAGNMGFFSDFGDKYVDPNLGPTGKTLVTPTTGPVGTWSIPVPFINPLGTQSLYTGSTYIKPNSTMDIQYVDNFTEFKKTLYGDLWFMGVNDSSGIPIQFLKDYAAQIGGTVFSSVYADRIIFKVKQPDAIWWCNAWQVGNGYQMYVLKQTIYEVGKEYTIPKEKYGNGGGANVAFTTESTGEKFQTVKITLSSGKFRIYADSWLVNGITADYGRYDKTLDSAVSKTFVLDDLPQGACTFEWKFIPYNGQSGDVTFKLEESYDIPKVKYGKGTGALLVKGAPFGTVHVEAQQFATVDYKEGNQRDIYASNQTFGTVTPEGHTLFTLPAGLWTVVNRAPYMNYGSTRTQLVPVSSEELTTVTLPESLKSANTRLNSMTDSSELTGGIQITQAADKTTTAEISVSVSDPLERDIAPTKENTVIYEGASKVEIVDIKRVVAPCSIALVIDSSGSMKNDMKATLAAAKEFIGTLPAGSFIKIIDFDAKVSVLKGETPADAVKALSGITAGGSTKLFDATLKGLETVKGKTRPAVVVFTDGVDSSMDKSGGGSVSTRSAVTAKIKESKIPVYTIGFGKRLNEADAAAGKKPGDGVPDIQTLLEFAAAAGGQYYPAKDPTALQGVFAAISSKLGNNFIITYARPSEHNLSETPFISMVVDNSGSMNSPPSEGIDCNFRMEKTISLFHDFVAKIPENAMMQFTTFRTPPMSAPLIIQEQITTERKANILKSLGVMKTGGGTPIVEALRTAYENILPVPSLRKVIVFLTDGGLQVDPTQLEEYNTLLKKIKEKNITILFIGMGAAPKEKVFSDAAAACGGFYVISENIVDIQAKLDKLLQLLKEAPPPDSIPLSLSINDVTPEGEELSYAVADDMKFSLPPKAGPPLEPDVVKTETGTPYKRYDEKVAASITGFGLPETENIITGKMTFDRKLANKAMQITVKDAVYLSRFMGVDSERSAQQFVALDIELENITSEKIPYQIPGIFNHFYFGVNGEGLYPASKATWLAEKPISPHGNPEITLEPGEKKTGVIVFLVPNSPGFSQQSLHFYDTNKGHIQIALAGKMSDKWLALDELPTSAPAQISDTFTLQVTATSLKPKIDRYPASERSVFRVVEAKFESKVQALLNLDPQERIWLKTDTQSGSLMSRMSGATGALPFGFLEPVMLGPASDNQVRMVFELPQAMAKFKSSLYFDLATGKAEIPVSTGDAYGAPKAAASVDGPGIKVIVNQLAALDEAVKFTLANGTTSQAYGNMTLLDVTIADLPGNEGTKIPSDFFVLVNKNYKAPTGGATAGRVGLGGGSANDPNMLKPNRATFDLVYGVDDSFGVFEGQSRRGIVLFDKPRGSLADWTLQSPYMESLNVPLSAGKCASPELLGLKTDIVMNKEFAVALDAAVTAAVARYRLMQDDSGAHGAQISLDKDDGRERVPMPSISIYGLKKMAQVTTEQQALDILKSLRCIPMNRDTGYLQTNGYEPEAVISQGWGEIGDMTKLARQLFAKLGFSPGVRAVELTEAGKKLVKERTGMDPDRVRTTPIGIAYQNAAGERKMLVIPFMVDISGLEGLVYYPSEGHTANLSNNPQIAEIRISVRYIPGEKSGTAAGTAGDAGSILGGSEGGETVSELLMLERRIPIATLSKDALDLGFMPRLSGGKPNSFSAVLSTPDGMEIGEAVLENPTQVLGIKIEVGKISGYDKPLVHYSTLGEGDSLSNFFQTIAINLPDLTEEAAAELDTVAKRIHDASTNPDPESIAKWYGRNIIYQFISGQSMFDSQMVNGLGLLLGRINRPRCLVVTSSLDKDNVMQTTLDLLQPWNEIQVGEEAAGKAYNLAAGFYVSALEAEVLPGDNKVGYLDLWTQAPADTAIQAIPVMEGNRDEILKEMTDLEIYPALLLSAVQNNKKLIFAPSAPTVFNGQKRWAWLEIDPDTYQAISVFDTGLHSGLTEFKLSLLPTEDDTMKWMKGVWVGTNISVWTMCSSSLKFGDNYAQVLNDAKATALAVAKTVEEIYSLVEVIKDKEVKVKVPVGSTHKIEFKISMAGIKGSLKQSMYSLSGGMKLAIDAYFKVIVPKPDPPKK